MFARTGGKLRRLRRGEDGGLKLAAAPAPVYTNRRALGGDGWAVELHTARRRAAEPGGPFTHFPRGARRPAGHLLPEPEAANAARPHRDRGALRGGRRGPRQARTTTMHIGPERAIYHAQSTVTLSF